MDWIASVEAVMVCRWRDRRGVDLKKVLGEMLVKVMKRPIDMLLI